MVLYTKKSNNVSCQNPLSTRLCHLWITRCFYDVYRCTQAEGRAQRWSPLDQLLFDNNPEQNGVCVVIRLSSC
jgi:steroid 5-alpha reductase family enzyme